MTKFNRKDFFIGKGYKAYTTYWMNGEHKFVARFRTAGAGSFVTFLIKNFTVEEYFSRLDAGEAPLTIAKSKGYLLPHIKRWLKDAGYPLTQDGYKAWSKARAAARDARMVA